MEKGKEKTFVKVDKESKMMRTRRSTLLKRKGRKGEERGGKR